jgi:hypothetical protein
MSDLVSLLEIITTVCAEVGLPIPTAVIGNQDQQVSQLLALANREGREMVSLDGGWPQLQATQTITLANGVAAYAFPTDFDSYIPTTIWNTDQRWPVSGPMTPQEWQVLKSGWVNSQPFQRFRIISNMIYFDPIPDVSADGQTVTIEYQSNSYCQSASGTPQNRYLADTDLWRLPRDIAELGTKWRFLAAKRLSYDEEKVAWANAVDREQARAYVGRTLPTNISDANFGGFLGNGYGNIQDGDWPGR